MLGRGYVYSLCDLFLLFRLDFLLAGFPCQPFSAAGLQLGFEDTRGTLFFEIERILKEKNPYGFLLENVEGLVNHDNGRTLSIIINHLNQLGYFVSYRLIDSQYFGLAQSRKRVYIVGTKDTHISLDNFEEHTAVLGDILEHGLATRVGANALGLNILVNSNDNLPVTILYPFGLVLSGILRFLYFLRGYSNVRYPISTNPSRNSSRCSLIHKGGPTIMWISRRLRPFLPQGKGGFRFIRKHCVYSSNHRHC